MSLAGRIWLLLRTVFSLGLTDVARVVLYRILLRWRIHPVQRLAAANPEGPFFSRPHTWERWHDRPQPVRELLCFGWFPLRLTEGFIPDWHRSLITERAVPQASTSWWMIPDFDSNVGDIKEVWELSRGSWMLPMAERAAEGSSVDVRRLNRWLEDWCRHNPPYSGPNWKCGQEAAFRVINLALSAWLLRQHDRPNSEVRKFLRMHLSRIIPTLSYAIGQCNNHIITEAAALYIGSSWLQRDGTSEYSAWQIRAHALLDEQVEKLIEDDGTFSQYSVNYHRLILEVLSIVEWWRRLSGLKPFSDNFYSKARLATDWLFAFIDPATGDAPNIGHNDGAHLLQLGGCSFRDYRPAVQLAAALFCHERAYGECTLDKVPQLLGLQVPPGRMRRPMSRDFDKGGFSLLRNTEWFAVLRAPSYRFRPSHADALHVDLWHLGENVLRDAGTYSYAVSEEQAHHYQGVKGHNTVQFDGHDQMPRVSRFLFGAWTAAERDDSKGHGTKTMTAGAEYRDWTGARHYRRILVGETEVAVEDSIGDFKGKAVFRWHLLPGAWKIEGDTISGCGYRINVSGSIQSLQCKLVKGKESRYYLQESCVPVLEVSVEETGQVTTRIMLDSK